MIELEQRSKRLAEKRESLFPRFDHHTALSAARPVAYNPTWLAAAYPVGDTTAP